MTANAATASGAGIAATTGADFAAALGLTATLGTDAAATTGTDAALSLTTALAAAGSNAGLARRANLTGRTYTADTADIGDRQLGIAQLYLQRAAGYRHATHRAGKSRAPDRDTSSRGRCPTRT